MHRLFLLALSAQSGNIQLIKRCAETKPLGIINDPGMPLFSQIPAPGFCAILSA